MSDDAERDEFRVRERPRESLLLSEVERASNEEDEAVEGAEVADPDTETEIGDAHVDLPRPGETSGGESRPCFVGLAEGEC